MNVKINYLPGFQSIAADYLSRNLQEQDPRKPLKCFNSSSIRRSQRRCSVRKGVLRSVRKVTGKHLCQSFFFNKIARMPRPAILLKKRLGHRCFPVNFLTFL